METQNNKDNQKSASKISGLLFVGSMFIGMALGSYFDDMRIGIFSGMGVGFVLSAVVYASYRNK